MRFVRSIEPKDRERWLELWNGYLDFYKVRLDSAVTDKAWENLLEVDYNMYGLVVENETGVQGISHYNFQNSTWSPNGYCYLEDLFVDPQVRGGGLGRALIDAVIEIGRGRKVARIYWNTGATNTEARILYDTYIQESGKVQYRLAQIY
jgi:ribosomal protein S18 acetylase RimI-like enzyme